MNAIDKLKQTNRIVKVDNIQGKGFVVLYRNLGRLRGINAYYSVETFDVTGRIIETLSFGYIKKEKHSRVFYNYSLLSLKMGV